MEIVILSGYYKYDQNKYRNATEALQHGSATWIDTTPAPVTPPPLSSVPGVPKGSPIANIIEKSKPVPSETVYKPSIPLSSPSIPQTTNIFFAKPLDIILSKATGKPTTAQKEIEIMHKAQEAPVLIKDTKKWAEQQIANPYYDVYKNINKPEDIQKVKEYQAQHYSVRKTDEGYEFFKPAEQVYKEKLELKKEELRKQLEYNPLGFTITQIASKFLSVEDPLAIGSVIDVISGGNVREKLLTREAKVKLQLDTAWEQGPVEYIKTAYTGPFAQLGLSVVGGEIIQVGGAALEGLTASKYGIDVGVGLSHYLGLGGIAVGGTLIGADIQKGFEQGGFEKAAERGVFDVVLLGGGLAGMKSVDTKAWFEKGFDFGTKLNTKSINVVFPSAEDVVTPGFSIIGNKPIVGIKGEPVSLTKRYTAYSEKGMKIDKEFFGGTQVTKYTPGKELVKVTLTDLKPSVEGGEFVYAKTKATFEDIITGETKIVPEIGKVSYMKGRTGEITKIPRSLSDLGDERFIYGFKETKFAKASPGIEMETPDIDFIDIKNKVDLRTKIQPKVSLNENVKAEISILDETPMLKEKIDIQLENVIDDSVFFEFTPKISKSFSVPVFGVTKAIGQKSVLKSIPKQETVFDSTISREIDFDIKDIESFLDEQTTVFKTEKQHQQPIFKPITETKTGEISIDILDIDFIKEQKKGQIQFTTTLEEEIFDIVPPTEETFLFEEKTPFIPFLSPFSQGDLGKDETRSDKYLFGRERKHKYKNIVDAINEIGNI
jgi:hypothetical protein